VVVGRWGDRIGTVRGIRTGKSTYGATVFCADTVRPFTHSSEVPFYALLLRQVLALFRTGKPPVSLSETLEMVAFMEAALESSQDGGRAVALDAAL
jgi:hypothetical protein